MAPAVIVDAHAHVATHWFEPAEVLLFQMDRNDVDRAVLVQHSGEFDNDYILDCVRAHPDRFAAVVSIDHTVPDAEDALRRAADSGAAGVRMRPSVRADGDDPLVLWRTAADIGLTVSSLGPAAQFAGPEFGDVLTGVPGVRVAIEHLGELRRTNAGLTVDQARMTYEAIRDYPDISVKIHGLGEGSPRAEPRIDSPFERPVPEVMLLAYDMLGADRLMWGSDFPPSSGREGYANALHYPREALRGHGMTPGEETKVFAESASAWFFRSTALA